jgi:hypothetical protein
VDEMIGFLMPLIPGLDITQKTVSGRLTAFHNTFCWSVLEPLVGLGQFDAFWAGLSS